MEIRYITKDDNPLEISKIYESSWKYTYKGIIPQNYLDSIPTGQSFPYIFCLTRESVRANLLAINLAFSRVCRLFEDKI